MEICRHSFLMRYFRMRINTQGDGNTATELKAECVPASWGTVWSQEVRQNITFGTLCRLTFSSSSLFGPCRQLAVSNRKKKKKLVVGGVNKAAVCAAVRWCVYMPPWERVAQRTRVAIVSGTQRAVAMHNNKAARRDLRKGKKRLDK